MNVSIDRDQLEELLRVVKKAASRQIHFEVRHSMLCNYARYPVATEFDGSTFCNCGVTDLQYAAHLAESLQYTTIKESKK